MGNSPKLMSREAICTLNLIDFHSSAFGWLRKEQTDLVGSAGMPWSPSIGSMNSSSSTDSNQNGLVLSRAIRAWKAGGNGVGAQTHI